MFIAHDTNNNRVSIEKAENGKQYFCPICGEPLIIRAQKSIAVKTHFSHKKGSDCDDFSHDMSEWHLNWQRRFPEECREVVVDNGKEKHRADVLIKNTVIEFQHSPISAEEIARRNAFYLSCGYGMVWVFDANGQVKNDFGDSLDPMLCGQFALSWKRAKQQFSKKMDPKVSVFLEYNTSVSIDEYKGKSVDILLFLADIDPKKIIFFPTRVDNTYYYLFPQNLVKQFYDEKDNNAYPIYAIINAAINYKRQIEQKRNIFIMRPVRRSRRL